jgi:hypothetical protein
MAMRAKSKAATNFAMAIATHKPLLSNLKRHTLGQQGQREEAFGVRVLIFDYSGRSVGV